MRFLIVILILHSSCSQTDQNIASIPKITLQKATTVNCTLPVYDSMKISISNYRNELRSINSKRNYDLLERSFVAVVVDSIFPYWYGTEWDFNGITQTPGKGTIPCGYFVITVLRDGGISLNRVKVGQSASQLIINEFADKKDTRIFSNKPLDSTLNYIKENGVGLFIIGLDNHVGFIYNDGENIWFIHSKWVNPKAVVKEEAAQSGILYYSKYRIVGKISNNKILLNKWLGQNDLVKS